MQVRNCIELYLETKVKPAKADSLPKTSQKASVAIKSYQNDPLHQSVNRNQNLILDCNYKSLKSSSKPSSQISSSKRSATEVSNQNPYHNSHHACIPCIFRFKGVKHQNSLSYIY